MNRIPFFNHPKPPAIEPLKNQETVSSAKQSSPSLPNAMEKTTSAATILKEEAPKSLNTLLQSLSGRVQKVVSDVGSIHWTRVKIQKISLSALATYSLICAKIVAGGVIPVSLSTAAAAIPLITLSAVCLQYAMSLIDYENGEILTKIKQDAKQMHLSHLVDQHGFRNIFRFEILDPTTFAKAFKNWIDQIPFDKARLVQDKASKILEDEKARNLSLPFTIPSMTSMRQKFDDENKGLSLQQLLDKYSADELIGWNMFSPEEKEVINATSDLLKARKKEMQEAREVFQKLIKTIQPFEYKGLEDAKTALTKLEQAPKILEEIAELETKFQSFRRKPIVHLV